MAVFDKKTSFGGTSCQCFGAKRSWERLELLVKERSHVLRTWSHFASVVAFYTSFCKIIMPKQWFPLESNPSVMNSYVEKMGMDVSTFSFHDVFSTEDWALSMVPQPVLAVVMLFPVKPESEEFARLEKEKIQSEGQVLSNNVYYMKQTIGNACGTVGILHAIGNARSDLTIKVDSYLDRFFQTTGSMTPEKIAEYLEADEEIEEVHSSAATEGQSEQQEGEVDTHFVCFRLVQLKFKDS